MKQVAQGVPDLLIDVVYNVLPNFGNLNLKATVAYGDPVPWSLVGRLSLYAVLYVTVVLGLGLAVFRRKEFH